MIRNKQLVTATHEIYRSYSDTWLCLQLFVFGKPRLYMLLRDYRQDNCYSASGIRVCNWVLT
jgi:hypothetical protein